MNLTTVRAGTRRPRGRRRAALALVALVIALLGVAVGPRGKASAAAPAFVQKKAATTTADSTSLSATLTSTPIQNDLLIVVGGAYPGTLTTPTGYTLITSPAGVYVWYKVAGASESSTVSVTRSVTGAMSLLVMEWSGMATVSTFDQTANSPSDNIGTHTTWGTGTTPATTQASELVIAAVGLYQPAAGNSFSTWSAGYTAQADMESTGSASLGAVGVASRVVAATGTQTATATWVKPSYAAGMVATFKASATCTGSLSVGAPTAGSVAATVGAGVATGPLPFGTWSDQTGCGAGWNGTIAMSLFHYQGAWVQTAGAARALGSTTSANYTAVGSGYYTVTVTSYVSTTLNFSYAGIESGTGTATLAGGNTSKAVGAKGVTIVWGPSSTTYAANMAYTIKVGNLSSTALTLADGGAPASIAANSGTVSPNPTFTNATANIPEGSGADPTQTVGAATKFVTVAVVNQGMGDYTVSPRASVAFDPSVWAQTYVAQVTYTIVSGP
ncbi:MAG TPA: hypothetical protein VGP96_14925 [Candidatus Dormibacteraeota bacterium]|nr:hypothetical protein [Candidatus Dormibacteraeota bacterium]